MFYEFQNSVGTDLLKIEEGVDFSFPPHIHNSFELILATEGEMTVCVDDKAYTLTPENAILIFPNQVHSLHTARHSKHFLCIFSPSLVQAYSCVFTTSLPVDNTFQPDAFLRQWLAKLQDSSTLFIKGALYMVCASFDKAAQYVDHKGDSHGLLLTIFEFVADHYRSDCSLEALSAYIAYSPVYLSRFFKSNAKMTFTDYVIRYRINEASYLLKNSQSKLLDIAYSCGFHSLRTFNRCFKEIMNTTPSEYRARQFK